MLVKTVSRSLTIEHRNVVEAVRHVRSVKGNIRALRNMDNDKVFTYAKCIAVPYNLIMQKPRNGLSSRTSCLGGVEQCNGKWSQTRGPRGLREQYQI